MILLVDIGNTRLKWAVSDGTQLSSQQAIVRSNIDHTQLASMMLNGIEPSRIVVSNVAGAQAGQEFARAIGLLSTTPIEYVQSTRSACGVTNAYPQPERLGTDRWMSVIAAHYLVGAACIATFGTAMTIDAVAADGRHLGGVIVPGPQLMVDSLLTNTSNIAAHSIGGQIAEDLFADNTLGAIHQGAIHACAALVEKAYASCEQRLGSRPALLLSGGASDQVGAALKIPFQSISDLVLRGLALVSARG